MKKFFSLLEEFIKKYVSTMVLVVSSIILVSCATQSIPPPGIVYTGNRTPGANESSVTIERTRQFVASAITMYVYFDGVAKMALGNGATGRAVVPNGVYTMEIRASHSERTPADISIILDLNSETVNYSLVVNHQTGSTLKETNRQVLANQPSARIPTTGIQGALFRAAGQTLINVPERSRIAIVFITAQDRSTTDFITGELEFILVNNGYLITDRRQLDMLRQEQNFQLSGEVDDATAVSIGRFVGADIIITGSVDGEGDLRRLRLRAIDTQTAQVIGVASERF